MVHLDDLVVVRELRLLVQFLVEDEEPVGKEADDGGHQDAHDAGSEEHVLVRDAQRILRQGREAGGDADADAVDEDEHQEFTEHVGLAAVPECPETVGDPGKDGGDGGADEAGLGLAVRHGSVHQVVSEPVVNDERHTAHGTELRHLAPEKRGESPDALCKCGNHDPPWPSEYWGPLGQAPILAPFPGSNLSASLRRTAPSAAPQPKSGDLGSFIAMKDGNRAPFL